jgi:hypothetical protein
MAITMLYTEVPDLWVEHTWAGQPCAVCCGAIQHAANTDVGITPLHSYVCCMLLKHSCLHSAHTLMQ